MQVRIAYLVSQYPAESHTFIRREVEALRARGVHIETFSIRKPSEDERLGPQSSAAYESTYYVLPASRLGIMGAHLGAIFTRPLAYFALLRLAMQHTVPGARALLWGLFHFIESIVLAAELKRRNITHLHNHFANSAATVGMLASRFADLPWSLTLHGISETDYPAGLLLGRKVAQARFVACVSWFGRAQAMRVTPPDQWQKFLIVRCGIDIAALPPESLSDRPTIVCVGRLSAEKGQLGLLQSFASARASGLDARLIMVGDGPDRAAIEALSVSLDIADDVHFAGRLHEQATLEQIAQAHLLVLPSFMEGLPVVLMEAMALGVPVIASHIAGVPELIDDGEEGLLFTPSDWSDLGDKMARVLSDPALRTRLSSAGRAKIEREFDINRAIAPLLVQFGVSPGQEMPE